MKTILIAFSLHLFLLSVLSNPIVHPDQSTIIIVSTEDPTLIAQAPVLVQEIVQEIPIIEIETQTYGQDGLIRSSDDIIETIDTLFETLELASKMIPLMDNKASMQNGANQGSVNLKQPFRSERGYTLGGISDSFMNLNTFIIPKQRTKLPIPNDDDVVRELMRGVWSDLTLEKKSDGSVMLLEDTKKLEEILERAKQDALKEENKGLNNKNNASTIKAVKDNKANDGSSGFSIVLALSFVVIALLGGMYYIKSLRRKGKKERFDEEKVPISRKYK